jgi:hypothetical protein
MSSGGNWDRRVIWTNPDEERERLCHEVKADRIEDRFLSAIIDTVVDTIGIEWKDKNAVKSILRVAIGEQIYDLLEQYLNGSLDRMKGNFEQEFGLDKKDIKIDYEHATHAKFSSIIKAIKDKHNIRSGT